MKALLLIFFIMISFAAFSQVRYKIQKKLQSKNIFKLSDNYKNQQTIREMTDRLSGMKYLAQDHMPCIVPNTTGFISIPNAWTEKNYKDIMPNPGPGIKLFRETEKFDAIKK
jgi:hypothetical protein